MDSFTDSLSLYQACHDADGQVQAAAYTALWQYLYRVALQVVRDQPDGASMAEDCAQAALIQIHGRLADCREPAAFRAWARQIVSHLAIDALRRQRRLLPLEPEDDGGSDYSDSRPAAMPEAQVAAESVQDDLYSLIGLAPISSRSRRVVLGRYQEDASDEELARREGETAGQPVLPSHVQVTRAKDIAHLRAWQPLQVWMERYEED